jgi:hypothetical protein
MGEENTGRKKIVIVALWTEICLAFPVIHALGEGYDVFFVTDASVGTSVEAHEMGIQRMIQAGAVPLTWGVFLSELQRDWARVETAGKIAEFFLSMAAPAPPIWSGNCGSLRDARAAASDAGSDGAAPELPIAATRKAASARIIRQARFYAAIQLSERRRGLSPFGYLDHYGRPYSTISYPNVVPGSQCPVGLTASPL